LKQSGEHKRVNDILLGPLERPALKWLAARQPAWMSPDMLTGIGIAGSVLIFASYWLSNVNANFLWLASLGLVINWYGDSLDGTVARFRKIERPKYGFFVDHTVDAFSQLLIVAGLGLSPYVRFDSAALALIGYLLMSVLVYVRTYVEGVFQISFGKFGPTEVRLIIILFNALFYFVDIPMLELPLGTISLFDMLIGGLGIVLIILFVASTIRQARELARIDG